VSSLLSNKPPRLSTRPGGWPVRRTPRWVLAVFAALVVVAVAVALVHKPSSAERASDLRGFLHDVTYDIESCAAGVGESLSALHQVQAENYRSAADVQDGISVAQQGAANCAPANNEQIDDLENYQVPQSLDSFGLATSVSGLVGWAAPAAEDVQTDVASVLSATTPAARTAAEAKLATAVRALDVRRAALDRPINAAVTALHVHEAAPRLPG